MAGGTRKTASVLFAIGVVLLLFSAYIALVYRGTIDAGAGWVISLDFQTWILIFFILFLVLALVLLVMLLATRKEESAPAEPEVDITCANCGRPYVVTDTGDRPLYHSCPYCGHSDVFGEEAPVEAEEPEEELVPGTIRETPTGDRELILRCSNCRHVFPTPYTEDRPLYAYCPNCGKKGVLTEPAPEAEAIETELAEEAETNVESVGESEDEWDEESSSPSGA